MSWLRKHWRWIVGVAAIVALSTLSTYLPVKDWVKAFTDWVQTLGAAGVVLFIFAYAVATVLFLPGWIFTVSAGLVYGVVGGTAVALSGAIIGSALSFLCARYLLRKRIEAAAKRSSKFSAIDSAIGEQGWKIVGLLRLSPVVPFNLSNYFYGITAVRFWPYIFASAVGMLPGTFLYAYLGAAGKASLDGQTGHSPLKWLFLGLGLVATIGVTIIVSRTAKKTLEKSGAARACVEQKNKA